jgi:hypothetical protein
MSYKIKWNWGTKLVIAIILFMGFIFVLVYMSTLNTIDLVERDYYPKGLQYQNRIEEMNNARIFRDDFNMTRENEHMVLSIPEIDPDSGSIVFFRPSNQLLDFASKIQPDSTGRMYFPLDAFQTGLYVMKIHWYQNAEGYYIEQKFFVN